MRSLTWAFVVPLSGKYPFVMDWVITDQQKKLLCHNFITTETRTSLTITFSKVKCYVRQDCRQRVKGDKEHQYPIQNEYQKDNNQ